MIYPQNKNNVTLIQEHDPKRPIFFNAICILDQTWSAMVYV